FLPADQVAQATAGMREAAPMLGNLSADPNLRGALGALSYGLIGVANGAYSLDSLAPPITMAADTVDAVLQGRPANFSWRALAQGKGADPGELRRFIQIEPILDFEALEPGRAATGAIVTTAERLDLAGAYQARVRLTGLVPMNDAEFATLQDHAALNGALSIAAVLIILWLALRSSRIILAAIISIACGLAYSAALGLFLVGALNLISVAFFVLFVGLGIDFGIQFSVRYRAERHDIDALEPALISTAHKAGAPLALAAAATALGFVAFLPFDFNPLHLQNPNSEAVATFLELRHDPQTGANAAEIIKPDLASAEASANQLAGLPEVAQARTLVNFIPADQERKLALIRQ